MNLRRTGTDRVSAILVVLVFVTFVGLNPGGLVVSAQSSEGPTVRTLDRTGSILRFNSSIEVGVFFSEPIFGFNAEDVTVVNGALSSIVGTNGSSEYVILVTPNSVGNVTVDIGAGVVEDEDGNGNVASEKLSLGIPYDDDQNEIVGDAEILAAVGDYFKGDLTDGQILALVSLYFSPPTTPTPTEVETIFDGLIPSLLEKWEVPGASIAIARHGRLVFAKGYGLADVKDELPVSPDSLFRTASISKPVTAVAALQLVENDLLGLDEKVFQILDEFEPPEGATRDSRLDDITVRHLLLHSGGWDRDKSFDAMWIPLRIERELGVPKPVTCRDVIRFMLGQPLDFDPGSQYAYSNFGYCLLGQIIEKKAGLSYEEYVRESVLEPPGISRMRIGGTLPEEQAEGEVTYYGYPGQQLAYSVMPGTPERVPWPYGGFHLRMMDAHWGWIASAIDLVRFATSVDGSRPPSVLKSTTVQGMVSRPAPPLWEGSAYYYGMGWLVRPVSDDANWWHNGSLPGTSSLLVRTHHGFAYAVLFNSRPRESASFRRDVDKLTWEGVREVSRWPSHDLFSKYGYE